MRYGLEPLYADGNPHAYDSLIWRFAAFGSRLFEGEDRITLFYTDIGVDPPSLHDLQLALKKTSAATADDLVDVTIPRPTTELLCTMSAMDYVITCRFHGVVLAPHSGHTSHRALTSSENDDSNEWSRAVPVLVWTPYIKGALARQFYNLFR
jgi:hypothetical protein